MAARSTSAPSPKETPAKPLAEDVEDTTRCALHDSAQRMIIREGS